MKTTFPRSFNSTPPWWLVPLLGTLVTFGPLSIDMYLPALPAMASALDASQGQMQYTLGAFFVGFCIGMLLYGPLSDSFGRRKLLLSGISLFSLASLLCSLATQVEHLIILRGIQAFGGGASVVMARTIARDVYSPSELPRQLSLMTLVTMIAPLLAPFLGGLLLIYFKWRSIFIVLTIVGVIVSALAFFLIPETLKDARGGGGDEKLGTKLGVIKRAFAGYYQLMHDKEALLTIGTLAFSFAGMFAFIAGSPFVYINYFGVLPEHYGLLFGCNVLGMIAMLLVNVRLLKRFSLRNILYVQSAAQLFFGVLLLMFNAQSLIYVVILIVLYMSLVNAIGANSLSLLLQDRGNLAGASSALAVSMQFGFAAVSAFVASIFEGDSPFAMTLVMAVCALFSWLCQHFNKRSKYD